MTRVKWCTIGFAISLTVLLLFPGVVSADYLRSDTIPDAGDWVGYKIGVHPTTQNIYAPGILSGELRVFDSTDYSPIISIPLSNEGVQSVDFNPSQNLVYAVGEDNNKHPTLWVIDGNTHVVDRTVQLSSDRTQVFDVAFNPTSNKIYITTWSEKRLYIVDANSYSVEHQGDIRSRGVAVNPDTNKVYVAKVGDWGADRLVVVDGGSNNILTEIDLPDYSKPAGVAVNSITNKVYVVLQKTNEVAVIDGGTDTLGKVISLGTGGAGYWTGTQKIWAIGVLSQCNRIFTVHFDLNKLYVIDGSTDTLDYEIDVEMKPFGIGVEQTDPCRVYVSHNVLNKISVFQDPSGCTPPPGLSAGPKNESNKVGDCHQILAILNFQNPSPNVNLIMNVMGANNVNQQVTTDAEGKVIFSYCKLVAGRDDIHIFADLNDNGEEDQGEPSIDLSKTWVDDTDSDGIPNDEEGFGDGDGDGVPNYLDTDADNDGIPDRDEGAGDGDDDGVPNYLDNDADGDGVPDGGEGMGDADRDGLPDFLDDDTDGSQDPWWPRFLADTDGDGVPDFLDWEGIYISIESSDITGGIKDTFALGESVYAIGSGYAASTTYDHYVVNDTTWTDGMAIPTRVSGTETTVTTDESGKIPEGTLIWASATIGDYDIIVDVNQNGAYDEDFDPIDDMDVNDAGFETVPEFTIIAIPVAIVLGLVFLISRRKRKE